MAADPQAKSAFITSLPREIRDAIYLELWRPSGLRQHLVFHEWEGNRHFCRWACTTEFSVQSSLQQDIEQLRSEVDLPLGEVLGADEDERVFDYGRRLMSPWLNHWACCERAEEAFGFEDIRGYQAFRFCWQPTRRGRVPNLSAYMPAFLSRMLNWQSTREERATNPSAYMSMLLLCKLISAECLQSMYESTTFIFTDMTTIQMFFGRCTTHPDMQALPDQGIPPPAFFKHARSFELSLVPTFHEELHCAFMGHVEIPERHSPYDFHWLWLDRFENLQNIKIWMETRSRDTLQHQECIYSNIKRLTFEELQAAFLPFGRISSTLISTPLNQDIGPEEEGYVEGIAPPGVHVYKRGTGDRFHPCITSLVPGRWMWAPISTFPRGEIRFTLSGRRASFE